MVQAQEVSLLSLQGYGDWLGDSHRKPIDVQLNPSPGLRGHPLTLLGPTHTWHSFSVLLRPMSPSPSAVLWDEVSQPGGQGVRQGLASSSLWVAAEGAAVILPQDEGDQSSVMVQALEPRGARLPAILLPPLWLPVPPSPSPNGCLLQTEPHQHLFHPRWSLRDPDTQIYPRSRINAKSKQSNRRVEDGLVSARGCLTTGLCILGDVHMSPRLKQVKQDLLLPVIIVPVRPRVRGGEICAPRGTG